MISDSTINDGPGGSRRAESKHLPIAAQPKGEDWLSDSAEEVLAHLNSSSTGRGSKREANDGYPVGWRHSRECAGDNFHRTVPVLRGRGVERKTGAKGENGAVALAATPEPTLEAPGS